MEPPLARHHEAIAPLDDIELRFLGAVVGGDLDLPTDHENILRHAMNLARLRAVRVSSGADVFIARELAPFLAELTDLLSPLFLGTLARVRKLDVEAVKGKVPYLRQETRRYRQLLLEQHGALLSAERLDEECRIKKLALALGGGGGAALAHIGLLLGLQELGLQPSLIAGTGLGALVGLLRAVSEEFEPSELRKSLPLDFDARKLMRRYSGQTRYGLLGVFSLGGHEVAEQMFQGLGFAGVPGLSELPIPMRVVVTGLKLAFRPKVERAESKIVSAAPGRKAIWRRMLVSLATSSAELAEDPTMLDQIVFGSDPGTRDFDAVDAVGFSSSIPGVVHYDVMREGSRSAETLDRLFDERGLFRLCDGGAVENVPARTAWEAVQAGEIGTRNVFVLAGDCFAPRPASRGLVLLPIQRYLRANVTGSLPYANLVMTYAKPPSPFRLVGNFERLERIGLRAREEFQDYAALVKLALTPLPPWAELDGMADSAG